MVNVLVTNPIWVVNNRCITDRKAAADADADADADAVADAGLLATLARIVADEGLGALYKGLAPAMVLVVNPIITYTIFESLKPAFAPLSRLSRFLLGALAKTIATLATYPYVVAKSRMQADKSRRNIAAGSSASASARPASARAILTDIYATGGLPALYAGIGVKLLQSVSRNALLFLIEDEVFKTLLLVLKLIAGASGRAVA